MLRRWLWIPNHSTQYQLTDKTLCSLARNLHLKLMSLKTYSRLLKRWRLPTQSQEINAIIASTNADPVAQTSSILHHCLQSNNLIFFLFSANEADVDIYYHVSPQNPFTGASMDLAPDSPSNNRQPVNLIPMIVHKPTIHIETRSLAALYINAAWIQMENLTRMEWC